LDEFGGNDQTIRIERLLVNFVYRTAELHVLRHKWKCHCQKSNYYRTRTSLVR